MKSLVLELQSLAGIKGEQMKAKATVASQIWGLCALLSEMREIRLIEESTTLKSMQHTKIYESCTWN